MEGEKNDPIHALDNTEDLEHASGAEEVWSTQEDSLRHLNEMVTVFDATTGKKILTGRVVGYTDLLGSGGILQPDPNRGFDNVEAAIRFPQDSDEFKEEMSKYRFRAEK